MRIHILAQPNHTNKHKNMPNKIKKFLLNAAFPFLVLIFSAILFLSCSVLKQHLYCTMLAILLSIAGVLTFSKLPLSSPENEPPIATCCAQDPHLVRLRLYVGTGYAISALAMVVVFSTRWAYGIAEFNTLRLDTIIILLTGNLDYATHFFERRIYSILSVWIGMFSIVVYFVALTAEFIAEYPRIFSQKYPGKNA